MNVFKATYKDREGRKRKSRKWYLDFNDHNQLRHKIPAFSDKRASEAFGRNIETLVNCRLSGLEPDARLNQWIETTPDTLLKKFVSWGLIDGQRKQITKPLSAHVVDYVLTLRSRGYSHPYTVRTRNRLRKIIADCRLTYFRDITRTAVEVYAGKLKSDGYKGTSRAHYLSALQSFLTWAERDQRIVRNPIAGLAKPARDSDKKGVLTAEQFVRLIKNTLHRNSILDRTTGQQRAVLYVLAGTTGLRRKELLGLTWEDIDLSADNPHVRVKACLAKNAKEARQPIPAFVVGLLTALKQATDPEPFDRVFASFSKWINTAGLIRQDLKNAGIERTDKDGNEICFHSLRNSYISFLSNSDTPPKVVQKLARHSDPRLTFNTYARTFAESEQEALTSLPNFGGFVFGTCLDKIRRKQEIPVDNDRQKIAAGASKTAILANKKIAPRGFEPLLPG